MHKAWILFLSLVAIPALAKPPRLTLFIAVDAMGSELLMRSRPRFKNGLSNLMSQGAYYPLARYDYAELVTSAGHTTLATGANPWRHGVVSNRIFNRVTGKAESIFADAKHPILEAPPSSDDVSPENLLAETISDRLRIATQERGKSVSISGKARSAIAMAGRLGTAWWFNDAVGKLVTGTYYAKEFPAWVKAFNEKKLLDASFGKEWTLSGKPNEYLGEDDRALESDWFGLGRKFPHVLNGGLSSPGPQFYSALASTPLMNNVMVQAAKAAIEGEQLGKDDVPDLLSISFSALDRTYHLYGPYSWEIQDSMIKLDKSIGELVAAAEKAAGKGNVLVVVSADHGGAAIPEEWAATGHTGMRVNLPNLQQALSKELQSKFGTPDLVAGIEEVDLYLNGKTLADRKLDGAAVRRAAAQWLSRQSVILTAVARDDLYGSNDTSGYLRNFRMGYYPERSGDVLFLVRPFHVLTDEPGGTSHGTPYQYESQVPMILWGKGIKAGTYRHESNPIHLAPTLGLLLEIGIPAAAEGAPLVDALGK